MRIDFSIAKPVFLCANGDNTFLINLHNAVNFPYKPVAGEEPDSPCKIVKLKHKGKLFLFTLPVIRKKQKTMMLV